VAIPVFDRAIELSRAAAAIVPREVKFVLTEGNYLLLDEPRWRRVRDQLDVVWHVRLDEEVRRRRLVARHVEFGKPLPEARAWVDRVDEPNARLVEAAAERADAVVDLTGW
jgi:pantothenate kinase